MSTQLPKQLVNVQLTNATVTEYTSPVNTKTIVRSASVVNNDTVPRTVTIYHVPSGGAAAAANIKTLALVIPPSGSPATILPEWINEVLEAGDFIAAVASTTAVLNLTISGYTFVGS